MLYNSVSPKGHRNGGTDPSGQPDYSLYNSVSPKGHRNTGYTGMLNDSVIVLYNSVSPKGHRNLRYRHHPCVAQRLYNSVSPKGHRNHPVFA